MTCPECGAAISQDGVRGSPRIYCSRRCSWRARERRKPLRDVPCRTCGAPISTRARGKGVPVLCIQHRAQPRPPRPPFVSSCRDCGVTPLSSTLRRLCDPCRNKHLAARRQLEGAARRKNHPERIITCLACGATITTRNPTRLYCNHRCLKNFRKIRHTLIGGSHLRVADLPPDVIALARSYRQMHKELQRKWQPGA